MSFKQNTTNPKAIADAISDLVELDPETYSRVDRQGVTVDLADSVPFAKRVIGLFAPIKREDIDILTDQSRQQISNQIYSIHQLLQRIMHDDPHTIRVTEVQNGWKGLFQDACQQLSPIIPYIQSEQSDQRTQQMLHAVQADSRQIADMRVQIGKMLEDARSDLAEMGADSHAGTFKKKAEDYGKAKKTWLCVSVSLAAATAVVGWLLFGSPPDDAATAISFAASRIFVLGVLSYALVWSGRIYRAAAHNQIVNEHRYAALTTFREFVNAASDGATKNAVLVQATQCIFSHRPSGFGQNEDDAGSSSHVLELTRNVIGGDKAQ
ncbi:MAG: hypothetical protein OXN97_14115 [Bryobacterales bacterium]|nr:hypothetical protein [Bryobacterales bacterium]